MRCFACGNIGHCVHRCPEKEDKSKESAMASKKVKWDKEAFVPQSFNDMAGKQAFGRIVGKARNGLAVASSTCDSSVRGADRFQEWKV